MHILITGGSGFVGRLLAERRLAQGDAVTVLSRDPARARAVLPRGVAVIRALDEAVAVQAIVNLAGENLGAGRWSEARKAEFRRSRIDGTRALLGWLAARPPLERPRVLVSGSAIGWYGSRGEEVLDERSTPGRDFSAELCRDWESAAQAAEALGMRVCRVRIGVVLDRDGGALAQMLPAFRLGAGGRLGDGRQWMSWIHREDLVALIGLLLDRDDAQGAFNGTAPEPVRNAEFARALGLALHRPALLPMPAFALRLLMGEMADLLLGSQRVLPRAAEALGLQFSRPTLASALASIFKHE